MPQNQVPDAKRRAEEIRGRLDPEHINNLPELQAVLEDALREVTAAMEFATPPAKPKPPP